MRLQVVLAFVAFVGCQEYPSSEYLRSFDLTTLSEVNALYSSAATDFNAGKLAESRPKLIEVLDLVAAHDASSPVTQAVRDLLDQVEGALLSAATSRLDLTTAPPSPTSRSAFVTLVTSDEFVPGAIVLAHTLHTHSPTRELVCLTPPDTQPSALTAAGREWLERSGWRLYPIDPEWGVLHCPSRSRSDVVRYAATCAKLSVFGLTEFDSVLFVDADSIALSSPEHMFKHAESVSFAAVSSPDWPHSSEFQTASFYLRPSLDVLAIFRALPTSPAFDFSHDLAILNFVFGRQWLSTPHSRFPYPTHVAQTAVGKPTVPMANGRPDLSQITLYDFAGPSWGKPWRVLETLQPGVSGSCEAQPLDAGLHQHLWPSLHDVHFELRSRWVDLFRTACAEMRSSSARPIPPLPPLEPIDIPREYFRGK